MPIIENTPFEKDLEERMNATMQEYPGSTAILVRRHGVYVWGDTWQKTKTQYEIFSAIGKSSYAISNNKFVSEQNGVL